MAEVAEHVELKVFPCPGCGATDRWRACYWQPANQGVELRVDAGGELVPLDYAGDEEILGDASENDAYTCGACGFYLEVAEFRMVPPGPDVAEPPGGAVVSWRRGVWS